MVEMAVVEMAVMEMTVMEMVMVMEREMSPLMERMSWAGLCKHCAGGVQGKSELQAPLNKEVRLLCRVVSGNFITTRERGSVLVRTTSKKMPCTTRHRDMNRDIGDDTNERSEAVNRTVEGKVLARRLAAGKLSAPKMRCHPPTQPL